MLIDAHLDLAFNAQALGGDLRLPLDQLRASAYGQRATSLRETPTVSLPTLRAVDVRIVFGTIFVQAPHTFFNLIGPVYHTPDEANEQGWAQLRYYHDLAAQGQIALIGGRAELDAALNGTTPLPGLVPLMEGADPIRDLAELEDWHAAGLRIVGPAWSATRYSGGTGAPGPLTPAGRELMSGLERYGIALDTSHLSEESFWEALRLYQGPLLASHANCRALVPTDRQLSDDMIRAIVERDGVIGIVPASIFLVPGWKIDDGKNVSLEMVVRHIEHICAIAGDTGHVGIGSDFDGGLGVEWLPAGMASIADLPKIGEALLAAGWSQEDVDGVLYGNWLRWLRAALP
ncbi:MAG TPA: membrane dipeptidase [Herpetosiphonaceae bacterium]